MITTILHHHGHDVLVFLGLFVTHVRYAVGMDVGEKSGEMPSKR